MNRLFLFCVCLCLIVGCNGGGDDVNVTKSEPGSLPVFTLCVSEYPSWSTFVVAGKAGIINPAEGGEYGTLEEKHQVDIVVEAKDYDSCIALYGSGSVDAACLTNMDSLNPALSRPTTAILPTSTSAGGDKVIAVGVEDLDELKLNAIFGLEMSVSQYTVIRGIESLHEDPDDFDFMNMSPEAAATALQTGSNDVKAICVWNPFAIQTLKNTTGAKTIFDSSEISGEIVDQVVVGNDSLQKEGGERFAECICDVYYQVCEKIWNDDAVVQTAAREALKQDFAPDLTMEDMEIVLKDTSFYVNSDQGISLYESPKFLNDMVTVVNTCKKMGVLEDDKVPTIGYNDEAAQLNFTTKYMK